MHAAFLVRAMSRGGIARQIVYLAAGLRTRGHRVSVIQFFEAAESDAELGGAGAELHTLGVRSRRDLPRLALHFALRIRELRPDVVYGFYIESNLLGLLGRPIAGAKVVWGLRVDDLSSVELDLIGRAAAAIHARLLRRADLVVANSHAGAGEALKTGLSQSRLRVIVNGVDTSRFRPDGQARERIRAEWNVPPHGLLIGTIGRLEARKGQRQFLRAAALFRREHPSARFVLVGSGEDSAQDQLSATARDLGIADRVIWAGPRTDIEAAYSALDLTTLLSERSEGCPNVVLESLACGVPCVVSDVGDGPRIVGDRGAVVASPRDAEAVARVWAERLQSWTPESAAATRRRIESEFSLTRMVGETEQALESIL